jgi:hypothetical protein
MDVPQTRNSYEFKSILDSRRGLPGPTPKPERPAIPYVDAWSFKTLAKGIGQVGTWLRLAFQSIVLSTDAYLEIARNVYMTGPALLISLLAQVVQSYVANTGWVLGDIILRYLFWFLTVLFMFMAARLLRGRSNYTATLRVVGFVSIVYFFELFSLLPVIGPTVLFLTRIVVFIAVWTSVSTAHEIRGWRTLLLPVVYILSIFISLFFLFNVIRGTGITIQNLLIDFGLTPK